MAHKGDPLDADPSIHHIDAGRLPAEIRKAHDFLFSRQGLTTIEQDMLLLFFTQIEQSHGSHGESTELVMPTYRFDAATLTEWFGLPSSKHLSTILRPAASRLAGQIAGFERTKGNSVRFDYRPIFSRVAYEDGVLLMMPNQSIWPELFEFSRGYARINHSTMRSIRGQYAKRLYELLSRFKDSASTLYPVKIDKLMGFMGVFDKDGKIQVKSFDGPKGVSQFIKRCVKEAIIELMEHPEVKRELVFKEVDGARGFRTIREQNKIVAIDFEYMWLPAVTSVDEAIVEDAKATIIKLSKIRFHRRLDDAELNELLNAYLTVDAGKFADEILKIQEALARRKEEGAAQAAKVVNPAMATEFENQALLYAEKLRELGVDDY